jgi:alkanesulfonate monooxygenase SsuD/methylene tetrahydromethanopterin reductase-like flavin-dependent oxidoreductase (luciferase family)
VAGLTRNIRLGIAVLCLPFRNPIVAGKQVATLDNLSRGRLTLGIGVGAPAATLNRDFEVLGVPRNDKYRRTIEYFNVMRTLWTEPNPGYQGRYVSFEPTEMNPKPVQQPHPPIWLGGKGQRALEMTAEFGNGWLPGGMSPDEYRERIPVLKQVARDKGRGEVDFTIGMEVSACIGRTSEEAQQASNRTFGLLPTHFAAYEDSDTVARSSLVGSTTEFRDQVGRFVNAGVQHFELKMIYQNVDHLLTQMELLNKEVMPSFA